MDKLSNPPGAVRIDTAGKPVSSDPIEGGACIVNSSVPIGEQGHVVYRELTTEEKRDRRKAEKAGVSFAGADAWLFLRLKRDKLLTATDFYELPPAQKRYGEQVVAGWQRWRQQLRDLPASGVDPEAPSWPTPPEPISVLLEYRGLWPELAWERLEKRG